MSGAEGKKYDLLLIGGTGFTGKLCLQYLFTKYPRVFSAGQHDDAVGHLKWGVCARNGVKLKAAIEEQIRIVTEDKKAAGEDLTNFVPEKLCPEILSDKVELVFDREKEPEKQKLLESIVEQTTVVISTAGPFDKYSKNLVHACVEKGVDYADISGETDYFREMIRKYDEEARTKKTKIVTHSGFDTVPWDLSVWALAEEVARSKLEPTEEIKCVRCIHDLVGQVSGGTVATMYWHAADKEKTRAADGDPLLLAPNSSYSNNNNSSSSQPGSSTTSLQKSEFAVKLCNPSSTEWNEDDEFVSEWNSTVENSEWNKKGVYTGQFLMAQVMGNSVKRSNALLGYGKKISFSAAGMEAEQGFLGRSLYKMKLYAFGMSFYVPPWRWILEKTGQIPQPGEGPTEEFMRKKGHLYLYTFADTTAGRTLCGHMRFDVDAGYKDTARMLVETGISLLLDKRGGGRNSAGLDSSQSGGNTHYPSLQGGVLTPSAACGKLILQRICQTGTSWGIRKIGQ